MRAVWLAVLACAACGEKKQEQAKSPPPVREQPVAKAPEPVKPREVDPPLPKRGRADKDPHPDYPTAVAAGTDKIFVLEDPDRGPKAPTSFARPAGIAWTRAPFCETYEKTFACGAGTGDWYIGKAKGVAIIEKRRGSAIDGSTVYVSGADGKVTQRLDVDFTGQVTEALLFTQPGRYTGRKRDGGNALDGCGMMGIVDDKQGRVVESRCLQWVGDPMRDTDGVAITKWVLDERGMNREWTNHGIDGAPVDDNEGVHRVVNTRDKAGRIVLRQQFSKFGVRVIGTTGCAGTKYEYDAAGHETSSTCLDTMDLPIGNHDDIAVTKYRYDAAGCLISSRDFDEKGAPAKDTHGVHGHEYAVDAHCHDIVDTCLGTDGRPHECGPEEPARMTYTRDARGRVISTKHFDAAGAPSADGTYGVFELAWKLDDADNFIEMACVDKDGIRAECGRTGFYGWRSEFDDAGREIAQTFFDQNLEPTANLGQFKKVFRYDNYDHMHESRSLDADGKPIASQGKAIRRNLWDATHRLFAVKLYDLDDKPARFTGCFTGTTCPKGAWHAARINRRADGKVLTNQFFDADGQLVETVDCTANRCFDD